MSVKHAILALLYEKPRHGYEVKTGFDDLVQGKWPLNPGQVYTTLDRLVRDELLDSPGQDQKDRKIFSITDKGRGEFLRWLNLPVERFFLRDEFYFKWLCARKIHFQQEKSMLEKQREQLIKEILNLTQFKQHLKKEGQEEDMRLLIDGALLHLEADMKWLEIMLKK
ncbi:PadR family transcriptional regulator [Paenibacillus sp. J2TS4]|uniref:PadR family transcriptional regulator n=1 Tax=Paenibacillus sp. J2TS4 TaxID=2807194 RepID=UPI001B105E6D|nr:PadR family transcriptional regulator [Paenibacillus sp. J2TS4]GIP35093.1 PadR family transcriptional regulator [Paenibacillus sp. J2TS4]